MDLDLDETRIVTASAYAGMMAPLTALPSTVCSLTGDTDNDGDGSQPARLSLEALDGIRRRWRYGDLVRLAEFVPKLLAEAPTDRRPTVVVPVSVATAWEEAAAAWPNDTSLLAPSGSEWARIADDKIFVREQLRRIGAPVPESIVGAGRDLVDGYTRLGRLVGAPFVLQSPGGQLVDASSLAAHRADIDSEATVGGAQDSAPPRAAGQPATRRSPWHKKTSAILRASE